MGWLGCERKGKGDAKSAFRRGARVARGHKGIRSDAGRGLGCHEEVGWGVRKRERGDAKKMLFGGGVPRASTASDNNDNK